MCPRAPPLPASQESARDSNKHHDDGAAKRRRRLSSLRDKKEKEEEKNGDLSAKGKVCGELKEVVPPKGGRVGAGPGPGAAARWEGGEEHLQDPSKEDPSK